MADMPKVKISELDPVQSINNSDIFEVSEPQQNNAGGNGAYVSKNMSILQLRDYIFASAFPPGCIYMTITPPDQFKPGDFFGGSWSLYAQGRTLFGVDNDLDGKTQEYKNTWGKSNVSGGSETLNLDENSMPQHRHNAEINRKTNTGAIEFAVRHPYDPQNSYAASVKIKGDRGTIARRGANNTQGQHPDTWNTGTVCKDQPSSAGDNYQDGDVVSVKMPAMQTTVEVEENPVSQNFQAASLYPPYVTCYIWKRDS